jgi:site-specific recombinase XerD
MAKKKKRRKPEAPIGLDKILTPAEEKQFMSFLISVSGDPGGAQNCLIFDLMLQTGLRVSELCKLRVKDCPGYLGGHVIRVHQGKGRKSRDIPVSNRIAANLSNYLKDYRPATLSPSVRVSDRRKAVFYSARKRPFNRDQVAYLFRKLASKAGIDKHVHPHMTRHTFATNALLKSRASVAELQVILGHSKLTTTQRYLHTAELLDDRLGNALDRGEWAI